MRRRLKSALSVFLSLSLLCGSGMLPAVGAVDELVPNVEDVVIPTEPTEPPAATPNPAPENPSEPPADVPETPAEEPSDSPGETPEAPENLPETPAEQPEETPETPEAEPEELPQARASFLSEEDISSVEYTVYPLPREIVYGENGVAIPEEVTVVYGDTIDDATRARTALALDQLGVNAVVADAAAEDAFNLLVGVRGAGDAADLALQDMDATMSVDSAGTVRDEDIFSQYTRAHDAHMIRISENGIAVVGRDTDAAFYGVTTLKHIFTEMAERGTNVARMLTIRDYAAVGWRGFIEGYYGIPWSNDNRASLMEWGGEWKMNAYVFAPKDDPYHKDQWRTLYPTQKLAEIEELARVGNETKCRYVYALHCFGGAGGAMRFDSNYANDYQIVIDKFEQLYDVGVRQFSILADDVGSISPENIARLMNDLNDWRAEKGDVYELYICPDNYNASWVGDGGAKLDKLNHALDDDVEIFWTGNGVCGHATKGDAQSFNNLVNAHQGGGTKESRNPLMWLNWPVDDINMSRLIMGPGSNEGGAKGYGAEIAVLQKGEADYFTGIISNPMQQAQLNKIPLFAVADFSWNDEDYDGQQSWADSFYFMDRDAGEALHEMAKHLSDPSPNGHAMTCGESEELKSYLDAFLNAYNSGADITDAGNALIREFDTIIDACEMLPQLSSNEGMLEEIEPFRLSLRDYALAGKGFVETAQALAAGDKDGVWSHYSLATASQSAAGKHAVKLISGSTFAQSGAKRIIPFVSTLADKLADPVKEVLDPSYKPQAKVSFFRTGLGGWYQGDDSKTIDGNLSTFSWTNANVTTSSTFGVTYSQPVTIEGFQVKTGDPGSGSGDALGTAVLEYKCKGDEEYREVGAFTSSKEWSFSASPLTNVVEMRVRSTANTNKWLKICEIGIMTPAAASGKIPATLFRKDLDFGNGQTSNFGPDSKVTDENDATYAHYESPVNGSLTTSDKIIVDAAIGLDFGTVVDLGKIRFLQGKNATDGDRMFDATLEYSVDGTNYTTIESGINRNDIVLDLSAMNIQAQYLRLRNGVEKPIWLAMRTMSAEYAVRGTAVFTNVPTFAGFTFDLQSDSAAFAPGELTLKPGEYIGMKLPRIRSLISITAKVTGDAPTIEAGASALEAMPVDAGSVSESNPLAARYIYLKNTTDAPITFTLEQLAVRSNEIEAPSLVRSTMGGEINKIENLFDGDLNSEYGFSGMQREGKEAVINLGQTMHIDSLQFIVNDTMKDWIRYAKVEGAMSPDGPWEHLVFIGNENNGATTDISSSGSGWTHTISYNYSGSQKGDEPLNVDARYLKITILKGDTSFDLWQRIREIAINSYLSGNDYTPDYMPSVNDPTFSGTREVVGHAPQNLIDGNVSTTYIPESSTGSLVYRLSDGLDANKQMIILQSPNTPSNAVVSVRAAGTSEFVTVGKLGQSMNIFDLSAFATVAEIKIEWDGIAPELHEIMFSTEKPEIPPVEEDEPEAYVTGGTFAGFGEDIVYALNLAKFGLVEGIQLDFEVDSSLVYHKSTVAAEGFTQFGDVRWLSDVDGVARGRIILGSFNGGKTIGDATEVLRMSFGDKAVSGTAYFKIIDIKVTKNTAEGPVYISHKVTTDTVQTVLGNRYDFDKNGVIDLLDLTMMMPYYMSKSGSADWASAQRFDVNGDNIVDMSDLLLVLTNFTA